MLEISQTTISQTMVAQCGASRLDRFFENPADREGERAGGARRGPACVGQSAGRSQRRQAGAEQRFADINIAQTGNALLIQQSRL